MKCPKCLSANSVHRSHRDYTSPARLIGWHRFRCSECNLYFEGFSIFSLRRRGRSTSGAGKGELPPGQSATGPIPSARGGDAGSKSRGIADGCPSCGSSRLRRSRRRGLLERTLYTVVGRLPFRCVQCNSRFYQRTSAGLWTRKKKRADAAAAHR